MERVAEISFNRRLGGRVDLRWPNTWHVTLRDLDGASLPQLAIRLPNETEAAYHARRLLSRLGGGCLLTYDVNGFLAAAEPVPPANAPARLSALAAV